LVCWLCVHTFLYFRYGIFAELESEKYIYQANYFLEHGHLSIPNFTFYSTQIMLIAFAIKWKLGFLFVYLIQLVFNGLSTYFFFRLVRHWADWGIAFFLSAILIFNFPYQLFTTFLQTESLYFSFSILFFYFLFVRFRWQIVSSLILILFLGLLCITRPVGIYLLPCTILFLYVKFLQQSTILKKTIFIGSTLTLSLFLLNAALGSGGEWQFMEIFKQEMIICGLPTATNVPVKQLENGNSIWGMLYYVFANFPQFLKLAFFKTIAFFTMYRSYYSLSHNLYLFAYGLPFIAMAFLNLFKSKGENIASQYFLYFFIFITWLSVIVSCDDWHNRFLFTLVPSFYLLSIPILQALKKWMAKSVAHKKR